MKLKLKINGNPVEVDLDSFTMGDMEDHEPKITQVLNKDASADPRENLKTAAEVIAKVVAERYPELKWEQVRRALPYGQIPKLFGHLVTGDEGNAVSPSGVTGANGL
jgi:hypothetical protein